MSSGELLVAVERFDLANAARALAALRAGHVLGWALVTPPEGLGWIAISFGRAIAAADQFGVRSRPGRSEATAGGRE